MTEVRQAIQNALTFLGDMYGESARDVRLEEVELSEDNFWYVTLSFLKRDFPVGVSESLLGAVPREYKVLAVSSQDGSVRSMKIRQLAAGSGA
jgi:hypothetical protein